MQIELDSLQNSRGVNSEKRNLMPETARWIGGFVRWLYKGCKTSLRDELEGNLDATWGGSYDTENYVLGVATVVVLLVFILFLAF